MFDHPLCQAVCVGCYGTRKVPPGSANAPAPHVHGFASEQEVKLLYQYQDRARITNLKPVDA